MEALFDGPVEFHDCDDVTLMMDGGSDEAGFVQIIRGKVAGACSSSRRCSARRTASSSSPTRSRISPPIS